MPLRRTPGRLASSDVNLKRCRISGGILLSAVLGLVVGCDGPQSALSPAGRGAEQLAELFWWMTASAGIIWIAVALLTTYAIVSSAKGTTRRSGWLIIGGGAVVPTIALTVLLLFGLAILPSLVAPAPEGSLTIGVVGEQWWWRVRYLDDAGATFETANELHLPVNEPVEFRLDSADVIHSFWIPSLGGKVDMIPGRTNRLTLWPTRRGEFRGVCAEYCGASHAHMSFRVIVESRDDFDQWIEQQSQPASAATEPMAAQGAQVFQQSGCGGCHAIRGTPADGDIGPDLTHVGSRRSLAADVLPNDEESFARWIGHPAGVKPQAKMPPFHMLPPSELRSLSAYLNSLQ